MALIVLQWSLNYFQQVNKLDAIDGSVLSEDSVYHPGTPSGCENQRCVYCFGMVYECCVSVSSATRAHSLPGSLVACPIVCRPHDWY